MLTLVGKYFFLADFYPEMNIICIFRNTAFRYHIVQKQRHLNEHFLMFISLIIIPLYLRLRNRPGVSCLRQYSASNMITAACFILPVQESSLNGYENSRILTENEHVLNLIPKPILLPKWHLQKSPFFLDM